MNKCDAIAVTVMIILSSIIFIPKVESSYSSYTADVDNTWSLDKDAIYYSYWGGHDGIHANATASGVDSTLQSPFYEKQSIDTTQSYNDVVGWYMSFDGGYGMSSWVIDNVIESISNRRIQIGECHIMVDGDVNINSYVEIILETYIYIPTNADTLDFQVDSGGVTTSGTITIDNNYCNIYVNGTLVTGFPYTLPSNLKGQVVPVRVDRKLSGHSYTGATNPGDASFTMYVYSMHVRDSSSNELDFIQFKPSYFHKYDVLSKDDDILISNIDVKSAAGYSFNGTAYALLTTDYGSTWVYWDGNSWVEASGNTIPDMLDNSTMTVNELRTLDEYAFSKLGYIRHIGIAIKIYPQFNGGSYEMCNIESININYHEMDTVTTTGNGTNPTTGQYNNTIYDNGTIRAIFGLPLPNNRESEDGDGVSMTNNKLLLHFDYDLNDYSGYNNDGIEYSPSIFKPGLFGYMHKGYVVVQDDPTLNQHSMSLSFWANGVSPGTIIKKGDAFNISIDDSYHVVFTVRLTNHGLTTLISTNAHSELSDDTSMHNIICIAGYYGMKIYVDGQLDGNNTYTTDTIQLSSSDMEIFGNCFLDELAMFQYEISDSMISNIYRRGTVKRATYTTQAYAASGCIKTINISTPYEYSTRTPDDLQDLKSLYYFDADNSNTLAIDFGGDINSTDNLDGVNSPSLVDGIYGNAIYFDGTTRMQKVGTTSELNIPNSLTICAWVNTTDENATIVSKSGEYSFNIVNGYLNFSYVRNSDSAIRCFQTTRPYVCTGKWMFVAVEKSGSIIKFFVNGKESYEIYDNNQDNMPASSSNLYIAYSSDSFGNGYYIGRIDEVSIFSRVLTANEIYELYVRHGETLKYQISTSYDGITWSNFYGIDGTSNTYFYGNTTYVPVMNDSMYYKIKFYFEQNTYRYINDGTTGYSNNESAFLYDIGFTYENNNVSKTFFFNSTYYDAYKCGEESSTPPSDRNDYENLSSFSSSDYDNARFYDEEEVSVDYMVRDGFSKWQTIDSNVTISGIDNITNIEFYMSLWAGKFLESWNDNIIEFWLYNYTSNSFDKLYQYHANKDGAYDDVDVQICVDLNNKQISNYISGNKIRFVVWERDYSPVSMHLDYLSAKVYGYRNLTLPEPYMVYVDDDYTNSTPGWGYDHFDKIQDGVDAVSENGTVIVYAGYYNNTYINKSLRLLGQGTPIVTPINMTENDAIVINSNNVTIDGFKLRGSRYGIYSNVTLIENITLRNITDDLTGDTVIYFSYGAKNLYCYNLHTYGSNANRFYDIENANSENIYICGGILGDEEIYIYGSNITVCGIHFDNILYIHGLGNLVRFYNNTGNPGTIDIIASNISFYNNTFHIYDILHFGSGTSYISNILFYNNTIQFDSNDGVDFSRIKYFYAYNNNMSSGSCDGIFNTDAYSEHIYIYNNTLSSGGYTIEINSDYTYIYNNTINYVNQYDAINAVNVHDVSIYNNRIYNVDDEAIQISGGSYNISIYNNTIINSTRGLYLSSIYNSSVCNNTISESTRGMLISNSNHMNISYNTVYNNTKGIYISGGSNNITLHNNKINDSAEEGIYLTSVDNILILNNNISSNSQDGIYATEINNINISHNGITYNHDDGIHFSTNSNHSIIYKNSIDHSTDCGIYFYSAYNNTIRSNYITNNNDGFRLYNNCTHNTIFDNYFKTNSASNAYDDGYNTWNISKTNGTNIVNGPYLGGNYWDDYTGTDNDGDGLGDTSIPHTCGGDIQHGGDNAPLIYYTPMVVYVDDDYNSATPGWQVDHFDNIPDGVNNVNDSGIVYVYDGYYNNSVTITKPVTVIGSGNNCIAESGGGSHVLHIHDANGVSIEKINISSKHASFSDAIFVEDSSNVVIRNISYYLLLSPTSLIYSENINNLTIADIFCNFSLSSSMGGFDLTSCQNATLFNNTVTINSSVGVLSLTGSKNIVVYNNCFINNNSGGVLYIHGTENATIYNNNLYGTVTALSSSHNISFNVTKNCSIHNILGGPCIGGNYYRDYNGTDSNGDGFGDTPYNIPGGGGFIDYLPLAYPSNITIIDFSVNLSTGWNMFGISLNNESGYEYKHNLTIYWNGTNYTWSQAVSNGLISNYIYKYDGGFVATDVVECGNGHWFYVYENINLISHNCSTNMIGARLFNLTTGWNLVDNAFNYSYNKSDVTVAWNGTNYNWSEAVSNGIISDNVYTYEGAMVSTNTFDPGKAFWIYAYKDDVDILRP